MKKLLKRVLTAIIYALVPITVLSCAPGCSVDPEPASPGADVDNPGPKETVLPADISEPTDYETKTWVALELNFETDKKYQNGEQLYVVFDAEFKNRATGTTLVIPGFWYGGSTFTVRFAPTEYGIWEFRTVCATDPALDGKQGTIAANPYRGDLDIYKHGFVTTDGSKHFVYADGTPFFYLGDTHWGMYTEEFNQGGVRAGTTGAESHFKYIVDKRVEQGFTVYQSEPINTAADLTDGVLSSMDARNFAKNDLYYQYIAEKGLVHANAEFFFAGQMTEEIAKNKTYLEAISRYWVARYSAYPVMWTLAQEIDKGFYRERGDQTFYDAESNPWIDVAEYLHKYDAYGHPLTGHQENTAYTTVTGAGEKNPLAANNGASAFLPDEVTVRTGHNWWAAQWSPSLTRLPDADVARDYWNSSKVAVNYEGRYCNLWTKDFGARAQSWIAMLSGFAGVGYGAIDIWLYRSTYDINSTSGDGIDTITPEDKAVYWSESVNFESAWQQGYMREFLERYRWWNLVPDFDSCTHFVPKTAGESAEATEPLYVCSTIGSDLYIVYFYSFDRGSGLVCDMVKGAEYEAQWFNPRTNEFVAIGTVKADKTDSSGKPAWQAPERPDTEDWVLVLKRI